MLQRDRSTGARVIVPDRPGIGIGADQSSSGDLFGSCGSRTIAPTVVRRQRERLRLAVMRGRGGFHVELDRHSATSCCRRADRIRPRQGVYLRARSLRGNFGSEGVEPGIGTGTTISPSIPLKSFGLQVYNGSPFASAVAAIMTS